MIYFRDLVCARGRLHLRLKNIKFKLLNLFKLFEQSIILTIASCLLTQMMFQGGQRDNEAPHLEAEELVSITDVNREEPVEQLRCHAL